LAEIEAWRAISAEYFVLCAKIVTNWKGGTSRIFVPSGKNFDDELYHFHNFCRISKALLAADSICMAFTDSDGVGIGSLQNLSLVRIGLHLTPTCSLTRDDSIWANRWES
jgi:hypothetical protein